VPDCKKEYFWDNTCHKCDKDHWYADSAYGQPSCHVCVKGQKEEYGRCVTPPKCPKGDNYYWDNTCHDCTKDYFYSDGGYQPAKCHECKSGYVKQYGQCLPKKTY